jgi:hypothetical protein
MFTPPSDTRTFHAASAFLRRDCVGFGKPPLLLAVQNLNDYGAATLKSLGVQQSASLAILWFRTSYLLQ